MLKIDWDAPLYSENGEEYLQIMVAEVADEETSAPLTASQGIFLSFEIAIMVPTTCPDYDGGSIIFNIEGGGGTRDGTVTGDYSEYISALENECEQLVSPIPSNYRTVSFDDTLTDFDNQGVIAGDYISFGFTYTDNSNQEIGWQCENMNNCPVSEVVLYFPGNPGTAIYIF